MQEAIASYVTLHGCCLLSFVFWFEFGGCVEDALSFILLFLHLGEACSFPDVWCAPDALNENRVFWEVLCADVAHWCRTLVV